MYYRLPSCRSPIALIYVWRKAEPNSSKYYISTQLFLVVVVIVSLSLSLSIISLYFLLLLLIDWVGIDSFRSLSLRSWHKKSGPLCHTSPYITAYTSVVSLVLVVVDIYGRRDRKIDGRERGRVFGWGASVHLCIKMGSVHLLSLFFFSPIRKSLSSSMIKRESRISHSFPFMSTSYLSLPSFSHFRGGKNRFECDFHFF